MQHIFTRTTGLEGAKAFLTRALASGKFPHALLIHGPEGVGQNALLLDLADILLCESDQTRPCGRCGSCLQSRSGNSERALHLLPLATSQGDEDRRELEGPQLEEMIGKIPAFLGDPYGYGITDRELIRIVQARDLQVRLGFAGAARRSRVVLVPWAESFVPAAANALLKTLEEPPDGTYFLMSSSNRKAILPTILSRCTLLPVAALDDRAFAAAVAARKAWWDGPAPARLIPFAEGSLGALLHLHREGGEALLEESGRLFAAALQDDWRIFSEYLEQAGAFDKLETAAPLLSFSLRAVRALHCLRVEAGPDRAGDWLPAALARAGWDSSLTGTFASLDRAVDLGAFAQFLESLLGSVQAYAKPRMAALGAWLEREGRLSAPAGKRAPGPALAGAAR